MNRKTSITMKITIVALSAAINIIIGQLVLLLKLPIYFDIIGTVFTAFLLGPWYAAATGFISGCITGVTLDIYSLYFMPVSVITGMAAGWIYQAGWMKKWKMPIGTFFMTLPGTITAALISAYFFGGFTSSGSSLIVMLFRKLGMNSILSVFVVQFGTDYIDRFLTVSIVLLLIAALPKGLIKQHLEDK